MMPFNYLTSIITSYLYNILIPILAKKIHQVQTPKQLIAKFYTQCVTEMKLV